MQREILNRKYIIFGRLDKIKYPVSTSITIFWFTHYRYFSAGQTNYHNFKFAPPIETKLSGYIGRISAY
ncbi:MAG: hypothetical protein GY820_37105 [Gammaproteobacteria bacterium]|nr:hypothetical protein [Gammaproteobacteria bacterium]